MQLQQQDLGMFNANVKWALEFSGTMPSPASLGCLFISLICLSLCVVICWDAFVTKCNFLVGIQKKSVPTSLPRITPLQSSHTASPSPASSISSLSEMSSSSILSQSTPLIYPSLPALDKLSEEEIDWELESIKNRFNDMTKSLQLEKARRQKLLCPPV